MTVIAVMHPLDRQPIDTRCCSNQGFRAVIFALKMA